VNDLAPIRHTVDTLNSDSLDALYTSLERAEAAIDRAQDAAALHRQGLLTTAELYAVIEATPAPGPAATEATEPADIQLTRKLGHGLIVTAAPPRARMALALLNMPSCGAGVVNAGQINIGDQVLYQVTGYDPEHASLLLELVEDWRPKPGATLTEADVEELKARWLATYGNNQGAHPVTELRPTGEEQPGV
jgi:hypothetical protein